MLSGMGASGGSAWRGKRLQSRFQHIDAMRAFAVALVVFSHAGLTFVPGGSGVTVFFCISGFVITYTMLRERERTGGFDLGGFYFRRAVKLAPPLVLIIVIPTLIYSLFHRIDWLDFLGQVFFFFNWRYTDSEVLVMPGSVVTWSLSIEEQFYLVIALVWLAAVRWRRADAVLAWVAGGVVVISAGLRVLYASMDLPSARIYFGTDTRMEALGWGTLAALWYVHRMRRNRTEDHDAARPASARVLGSDAVLIGSVLVYLLSLVIRDPMFRDTLRYTLQAGAATALILWGLSAPSGPLGSRAVRWAGWRPLQVVGLASYSIYLLHHCLNHAMSGLLDPLPFPVAVAIRVGLGFLGGVLIWMWIEQPVQRWRQRRSSAPSA